MTNLCFIWQKKNHTSRIYSFHKHFRRCWSNYKIFQIPEYWESLLRSILLSNAWIVGSDMTFFLQSKLKWNHTMTLKGSRIGRDSTNWYEWMKIVSSIRKSNNDGKISNDYQAEENNCNMFDFIRPNFVHCFWNFTQKWKNIYIYC